MPSPRPVVATSAALAAATFICSALLAHIDDNKVFDRIPPYEGPGYRAALGGAGDGGVAADTSQFASSNVTLLSWLPLSEWPGANNANVVEGYVSQSGREYALLGLSSGTAFVEVTNPSNATKVGFLTGPASLWRDIRTYGTYAYAISEGGGGIQVFDLTQIDSGVVTQVNTIDSPGGSSTHTVFVDHASGFLYRAGGGSNGLRIYSLANPANPVFVGQWQDRYVHEVTVVAYTEGPYAGKQIAFACGGLNGGFAQPGLHILDVTDKSNIQTLSIYLYPNAQYSHQGWLTEDRKYFYLNDEKDEQNLGIPGTTRIIDVQNLSAPVQAATWTNGNSAIDHNLYTRNGKAYLSNYRSGLRVLDLSNPLAPVEVGFFDTYPSSDSASFNGLWDNDPYLPSGTILGSDIERGLFVWYEGPSPLNFTFPEGLPNVVSPEGQAVTVQVDALAGQSVVAGSVKLVVQGPNGTVEVPATVVGPNLYSAVFPAFECLDEITYSFVAEAGIGISVGAPTPAASALVAYGEQLVINDTIEIESGWTVGAPGDNAPVGVWTRVDPVGTTAQPEDDHTVGGTICWVTGQGEIGGGAGSADVDSGSTTLLSPLFDASGDGEAILTYHRWYSNNLGNNPNEDSMPISISNDGGASWSLLEDVTENAGQWVRKSFRVADFVTPTATMRLRFVARDLTLASLVEAGVDDVRLTRVDCTPRTTGDLNGDGVVDGADLGALLANWGQPGDTDLNGDGTTDGADLGVVLASWG